MCIREPVLREVAGKFVQLNAHVLIHIHILDTRASKGGLSSMVKQDIEIFAACASACCSAASPRAVIKEHWVAH